jgi:hypothetical protein
MRKTKREERQVGVPPVLAGVVWDEVFERGPSSLLLSRVHADGCTKRTLSNCYQFILTSFVVKGGVLQC